MWMMRSVFGPIVLGCVCISCIFAFAFGAGRGATEAYQWIYGFAAGGLDLFKASCPIWASHYYLQDQKGAGRASWACFAFLTVMSLYCAWGTSATQLAERMGLKATVLVQEQQRKDVVARLKAERSGMANFTMTSPATVKSAEDAVAATVQQRIAECEDRGKNCRAREADERTARDELTKAQRNLAASVAAQEVNVKIDVAEAELAKVNVNLAVKDVDPQSASIAKITGISETTVAAVGNFLFAVAIEIGSGIGLWLVFGHRKPTPIVVAPPFEGRPPEKDALMSKAQEMRAKFFKECVHRDVDNKVPAGVIYGAYVQMCIEHDVEPMKAMAFGRSAPWHMRKKVGGVVHYCECALNAATKPSLRLVAK